MKSNLIEWRDEFALDIPEVDQEHRALIELINSVYQALMSTRASAAGVELLGELHAAISAHFALEERLMREQHYDDYEAHKADHETLLDEVLDLMDELELNARVDLDAFSSKLAAWFTEHFGTHDARMHRILG